MARKVSWPAHLLAELTILHSYVEKELEGVANAVNNLLEKHNAATAGTLLQLLSGSKSRILAALARQRILLWECSNEKDPAAVHADSEGSEVVIGSGCRNLIPESTVGSIQSKRQPVTGGGATTAPYRHGRPSSSSRNSGVDRQTELGEELQWKRDKLVRMRRLLRRKADQTEAEAERGAIGRDIAKIDAAVRQLQSFKNSGQLARQVNVSEGGDVQGRLRPPRSGAVQAHDDETGGRDRMRGKPPAEGVIDGGNDAQSLREIDLRLPDGLDVLLGRIAEGIRPYRQQPASGELSAPLNQFQRGNSVNSVNNTDSAKPLPGVQSSYLAFPGRIAEKTEREGGPVFGPSNRAVDPKNQDGVRRGGSSGTLQWPSGNSSGEPQAVSKKGEGSLPRADTGRCVVFARAHGSAQAKACRIPPRRPEEPEAITKAASTRPAEGQADHGALRVVNEAGAAVNRGALNVRGLSTTLGGQSKPSFKGGGVGGAVGGGIGKENLP